MITKFGKKYSYKYKGTNSGLGSNETNQRGVDDIITTLPESLWPPNLAELLLTLMGSCPQIHKILDHVVL